jgi:hypothetical protein
MRTPLLGLLIAAIACFALEAGAATYKWVDKDGKVHYSDQPVAGAEKVDLKPLSEIPSEPLPQSQPDQAPPEPLDSATQYSSMSIASPKEGETLRGSGISLNIVVDLQPGLGGDDRIEYLLDGKAVTATVPNIERGTHSVSARVVSPDGATKISAPAVGFTVFQNVVAPPPPPATPKPATKK